ncbi:MAG TPA: hypothetical protein PL124_01610 [Candidatus Cloacimonadota bacterium]|nr:hypothetical protein [Candidatus Cloacimonadota bacterium]HPS38088.1 hypothetical protein [Candidatus Cloacimonadota bacterium]
MKATFIGQIQGYSGKYKQVVYCQSRMFGTTYVRQNVYPTITEHHVEQGSKTAAIFAVLPSEGYKEDMKDYLYRYNSLGSKEQRPIRTWANLYMKLMFNMTVQDTSIDLRTITRDYIYEHDLPCVSLKRAIEAGLLPKVSTWERYINEI